MHSKWAVFGTFIISLLVSYGFTPLARKIALNTGMIDHPESKKAHINPTPLLGGLAIFLGFIGSIVFAVDMTKQLTGILIGAGMLFALGLVDDKYGMMPQLKLSVQILAALTAFRFGLRITTIEDYYLCMFFTVFWFVGITNALNLLDNLNGLSSGISAISAIFFAIIALLNNDYVSATLAAGIAGGCLGFLRYNFPKAHIFMGDTGSLVLGYLLACLAMTGSWKTEGITLSLSIPVVVLGYPIFDTTLVTMIRILEGRSVFQGGRDHSSHILAYIGFKKKRAVLTIFLICVLLGMSSLVIRYSPFAFGFTALVITAAAMAAFGLRLLYLRKKMVHIRNVKHGKIKNPAK